MGFLVSNGKSGKLSFSGTEYVNPTHGTKRLCLRTGTGPNDIVKYGLTTDAKASSYCGIKMVIKGNTAYIGRSESEVEVITSSSTNTTYSQRTLSSTRTIRKNTGQSVASNINSYTSEGPSTSSSSLSTRSYTGTNSRGTYTQSITTLYSTTLNEVYRTEYRTDSAPSTYGMYTVRSYTYSSSYYTRTYSFTSSISYKGSNTSGNHNFNI